MHMCIYIYIHNNITTYPICPFLNTDEHRADLLPSARGAVLALLAALLYTYMYIYIYIYMYKHILLIYIYI